MFRLTRAGRFAAALTFASLLSACGTTYQIPDTKGHADQTAEVMFAQARAVNHTTRISANAGQARFNRVASRIVPVAQQLCTQETANVANFDCQVRVEIDRQLTDRNAYFTYVNERPVIRMSMPLLQDTANDDEVAFVMGHEFGHLIGRHIHKQQQQQLAGALILGAVTAAANAQAASAGQYYDPNAIERNMAIGAAVGSMAYSQTFELESDMLGTRIASAAGYDAVKGARYFAKPEDVRSQSGQSLSFWGTHPPNKKRLATVIATQAQVHGKVALTRTDGKAKTK